MNDLFFREEHTMLVDMVRDFAKNEIEPVARELDEEGRFPEELVSKMADLGLMGIPIPEEYGGCIGSDYGCGAYFTWHHADPHVAVRNFKG